MTFALVFDLDGTLVDSAPDITTAVNRMLAAEGLAALDLATVTSFVGKGLPHLVAQVIDHLGLDKARHGVLTAATLAEYNRAGSELTRPYPGVIVALEALKARGAAMGICTNKPIEPARHVLADLGLDRFFDVVIGGDSLPTRKPNPEMLHAAFAALPDLPRIYVGDSEVDAETAQNAEVPFLLFTQGYRKRPVAEVPHRAAFADFSDLPGLASQALAI